MMWSAMGAGAPWWHWVVMAGVWVAGIGIVAWVVTTLAPGADRRTAQQILDERLARGELDVDEYRRRSDELLAHGRTGSPPDA